MSPTTTPLLEFLLGELSVRYEHGSLQHHQHGYQMARRTITTHNLIYVLRGRVRWTWGQQPVDFAADQWVLVEPGCPHHAESLTKRVTLLSFHFDLTLQGGRDALAVLQLDKPLATSNKSRLAQMMRMCHGEYQRDQVGHIGGRRASESHSDMAGSVGESMLALWSPLVVREMFREADRQGGLKIQSIDPTVAKVVAWMHDHVEEPVDALTLETVSGYSSQHLNRMFKQSLGLTAMKYFTRLRIERASQLLREGRLSIAAIAEQVGYESPFYFSRVFRQHLGVSPRNWQQAKTSDRSG